MELCAVYIQRRCNCLLFHNDRMPAAISETFNFPSNLLDSLSKLDLKQDESI